MKTQEDTDRIKNLERTVGECVQMIGKLKAMAANLNTRQLSMESELSLIKGQLSSIRSLRS